jgi:hypothetical protein
MGQADCGAGFWDRPVLASVYLRIRGARFMGLDEREPMMTTEDEIWQREGEKLVAAHRQSIDDLDAKIADLRRRRDLRQGLLDKAELQAKGVRPCKVCNRHVPSPCNSAGGMAEGGPWDSFCREFMENRT